MNNSIGNLNVSCDCVKSNINESSAERLKDARCNSVVLFSTGLPSIYGNRTLSYSNNLKYSHISRNMVYIRRLIREFIATREFTINNNFNAQSTINYIRSYILESFKSSGVIQDYNIDYTIDRNSMFITIDLLFNTSIEYITLNFTL
jgi:phage tail sheath protein FI